MRRDKADLDLAALRPAASVAALPPDLTEYPTAITVCKVKQGKCNEIGSCQTMLANLVAVDVAKPPADDNGDNGATFQLRTTANGGHEFARQDHGPFHRGKRDR